MPRPHIEFIQSQMLPWQQGLYGGARPDVEVKTLSFDDTTGASSLIIRYAPGWVRTAREVLCADEELFVLEGSLSIGNVDYGKHGYAHLPAGFKRDGYRSDTGAVILTFFSAEPTANSEVANDYDERRLVLHLDALAMEGEKGPRRHMGSEGFDFSGTMHKKLHEDPDTGERSWLIGLMPGWFTTQAETHPVCEEEFAVSGDISLPNGVMRQGGYFWRPENIQHGPFGTIGGTLHFCRGMGGAFSTIFEDKPERLNWTPDYRPIVPDHLKDLAVDQAFEGY